MDGEPCVIVFPCKTMELVASTVPGVDAQTTRTVLASYFAKRGESHNFSALARFVFSRSLEMFKGNV